MRTKQFWEAALKLKEMSHSQKCITTKNLEIWNNQNKLTFINVISQDVIDLTLTTSLIAECCRKWHVFSQGILGAIKIPAQIQNNIYIFLPKLKEIFRTSFLRGHILTLWIKLEVTFIPKAKDCFCSKQTYQSNIVFH